MSDQRYEHEAAPDGASTDGSCVHCGLSLQYNDDHECAARLRAALDTATRERDEALARPAYTVESNTRSCHEDGERPERERVVAWLRSSANAPHPVESGEYALSPAGRGLGLLWADAIERGEYEQEGHDGQD